MTESMVWNEFIEQEQLTPQQVMLFKQYQQLLLEWNEKSNLTRIVTPQAIIQDHFQDSIKLRNYLDMTTIQGIADVGSGAGFPGIPLKIMFPHLSIVLIEVTMKKVQFLETVCRELDLNNVIIASIDWRTFLRTTDYHIDLFCARASLQLGELLRIFKPGCVYRQAQLVYWASKNWQPEPEYVSYVDKDVPYTIGSKQRRYIFFKNSV
jgi:16S rRNA (guanine527-N7)-methyltransferase